MKAIIAITAFLATAASGLAKDGLKHHRSSISGTGTTSHSSSFISVSSSTDSGDMSHFFGSGGNNRLHHFNFGSESLEERIQEAQSRLHKLYFIRDVCPELEKTEIELSFNRKSVQDVVQEVNKLLGKELPATFPEGEFTVGKTDVSGMKADDFLNSVAHAAGLELTYTPTSMVFSVKKEVKTMIMPDL